MDTTAETARRKYKRRSDEERLLITIGVPARAADDDFITDSADVLRPQQRPAGGNHHTLHTQVVPSNQPLAFNVWAAETVAR